MGDSCVDDNDSHLIISPRDFQRKKPLDQNSSLNNCSVTSDSLDPNHRRDSIDYINLASLDPMDGKNADGQYNAIMNLLDEINEEEDQDDNFEKNIMNKFEDNFGRQLQDGDDFDKNDD